MTLRNAIHTRSDRSLSLTAIVSSSSTFLISTDDPSLIQTMAPAPALAVSFKAGSSIPVNLVHAAMPPAPAWRAPPPAIPESGATAPKPDAAEAAGGSEPQAAIAESRAPEALAAATEPEDKPSSSSSSSSSRIELIIDSLPNHTLIEPIPVTIQSLGDKVFTASVCNLPIHATGNSIGESLLVLKEQIEEIYADLSKRLSHLDSDQKELLQLLATYIPPATPRAKWF